MSSSRAKIAQRFLSVTVTAALPVDVYNRTISQLDKKYNTSYGLYLEQRPEVTCTGINTYAQENTTDTVTMNFGQMSRTVGTVHLKNRQREKPVEIL